MKRVFTVLILLVFTFSLIGQTWTKKSDFPGEARFGASSFVIGNDAYVGLGENNGTFFKDFWKYEAVSDSWTQIADFPGMPRAGAVAFSINGKGYAGVGETLNNGSREFFIDFYEYDPTNDSWTPKRDFSSQARSRASVFVVDNVAYVGNGLSTSGELENFAKFDGNSWDSAPTLTDEFKAGASGFSANGKGYVVAGAQGSFAYSSVYEFDPGLNSWDEKIFADGINLPFNRAGVFVIGDKAYICYGNQSFITEYDISTNTPTKLGDVLDFQGFRIAPVAFSIGNKGYFGLGLGAAAEKDFWEFGTPSSTKENEFQNSISIAPSVSSGVFQLKSEGKQNKDFQLKIFDLSGKQLKFYESIANNQNFDLSKLKAGMYLVQIIQEEDFAIQKIMIF